jgi:hypothetical protein
VTSEAKERGAMLTLVGEILIDLVFVASVVVTVSCLAHLLSLTVREQRELKAAAHQVPPARRRAAGADGWRLRSLRPGIARHHTSSG